MIITFRNKDAFVSRFVHKYEEIVGKERLIDFLEQDHGTGGWQTAFEYACEKTLDNDLFEYCDKLQWDEYDRFSRDINDIILVSISN